MKSIPKIVTLVALTLCSATSAYALPLLNVSGSVQAGDPSQLGRLSRNGVPQDWAGSELFPGVINPATAYNYLTYSVNVGSTPFVQINIDSESINTFVSAYDTAYLPNSLATNWLGDAGSSGNLFGNPIYFNVVVPVNHTLVVVINTTAAAGIGAPFNLLVEGFLDTEYTDPSDTTAPEPATIVLSGAGLLLVALRRRKQRRA